jgi:hypothetical protein
MYDSTCPSTVATPATTAPTIKACCVIDQWLLRMLARPVAERKDSGEGQEDAKRVDERRRAGAAQRGSGDGKDTRDEADCGAVSDGLFDVECP